MLAPASVHVPSQWGAYTVVFGSDDVLESALLDILKSGDYFWICPATIKDLICSNGWLYRHLSMSRWICIPDGEAAKTIHVWSDVISALLKRGASRHTTLIALGGGAVSDLVGFVASTFMRGISYLSIPTTLLAMVDASVGGKTALNQDGIKNSIGTFYPPKSVLIMPSWLLTLSRRAFLSGMAEVVKYGLIHDSVFWEWLRAHRDLIDQQDPVILCSMIQTCCQIKADFVAQDETDQGVRRFLNFGHTLGHAIEGLTLEQSSRESAHLEVSGEGEPPLYLHGEAVAIGMAFAVVLSRELGLLNSERAEEILAGLHWMRLPTRLKHPHAWSEIVSGLMKDKKKPSQSALSEQNNDPGSLDDLKLQWVLLKDVGVCVLQTLSLKRVQKVYEAYFLSGLSTA